MELVGVDFPINKFRSEEKGKLSLTLAHVSFLVRILVWLAMAVHIDCIDGVIHDPSNTVS